LRKPSLSAKFQSSPSPKAGRNLKATGAQVAIASWFQSSPSPKAGRNFEVAVFPQLAFKFQSSPSPKAGRNLPHLAIALAHQLVPILTQPESWAQFYWSGCQPLPLPGSNPHPARKLGAIQ